MNKTERIHYLVETLNKASEAYYGGEEEIMSNAEWDAAFDELARLEEETGIVLPDSPTNTVGTEQDNISGQKEPHEFPALSLAKSKDAGVLEKWAGTRPIWLSWKLDGLTVCATYDNGSLTKLMTRGNGIIGTNITYLAKYIRNIPMKISYNGHLVVRGEAIISYPDFERLNAESDTQEYSNPRNLASGTLSLDPERASEAADRCISMKAFTLVYLDEHIQSWGDRMDFLSSLVFSVVEHKATDAEHLRETIDEFTKKVNSIDFPVDGLVICYDDTDYASTGSVTGHHATNAGMAFKWQDTVAETTLDHIEWSCASSVISPVAVFDKVDLEGTEVRRASLCNISEMKRLGIGADRHTTLSIIKANMIIPKCIKADNHGTSFDIPEHCPVCGAKTEVRMSQSGTETLICTNPNCVAKEIKNFTKFVSKDGMNIDGLSEKTILKFINFGWLGSFADIFRLHNHKDYLQEQDGFGEKSVEHLLSAIEDKRNVSPVNFVYALCIPLIGQDASKQIIKALGTKGFFERLASGNNFLDIDGIGKERSDAILCWYAKNKAMLNDLLSEISVEDVPPAEKIVGSCSDLTFVITGNVHYFKNRSEFKLFVENNGGKVADSVSSKTNYLVNNDISSVSGKNKKAKDLGIPIITEDDFVASFVNK